MTIKYYSFAVGAVSVAWEQYHTALNHARKHHTIALIVKHILDHIQVYEQTEL